MRLGFIGLGAMGGPIAANLVQAGHAVRVWNRSSGAIQELSARGAEAADTPAAAARGSAVLLSMLADDAATRAVLLDGGALTALARGSAYVNMATVSVALAREMAERCREKGIGYVAAPVLGRPDVARAGALNILASGDPGVLDSVQPLFDVIGQKTWRFGAKPEQANAVKLALNFMLASAIESMGEAVALVSGYGVSRAAFVAMATSTAFAAPAYKTYGDAIVSDRVEPAGFKLALGLKDVRLALSAAEGAFVPMPFASVLKDNFLDGMAHGEEGLDWAALVRVSQRRSGQR